MLLSSFSHYSVVHMLVNMYVLWTFSTTIVSVLGKEQFLAFYTSAGAHGPQHGHKLSAVASLCVLFVFTSAKELTVCVCQRLSICLSVSKIT